MTTITVIDSIMGSGKTSWAIDKINNDAAEQLTAFLYITPFLTECDRVTAACPSADFRQPKPVGGSKLNHLNDLLAAGESVASTHTLFNRIDNRTFEVMQENDTRYTLIVDEETEVCREYEIKPADLRTLHESRMIEVDPKTKRVSWNYKAWPGAYDGRFSEIKSLCDTGSLVLVADTLLVWEFPIAFLQLFHEVYILTYLFRGSVMDAYLRVNNVPYDMKTIREGALVDYESSDEEDVKRQLRDLITVVVDPKLNAIGKAKGGENPLSGSWFEKDLNSGGKQTQRLRKMVYSWFFNGVKGRSSENMWASFKRHAPKLKGKGYSRGWTPVNLRATNDHAHRKNLAYLANIFMRPRLMTYFKQCSEIEPSQDLYAVSQLVQWIWRSRIRRGLPITVWIPSERMRVLFLGWLYGDVRLTSTGTVQSLVG